MYLCLTKLVTMTSTLRNVARTIVVRGGDDAVAAWCRQGTTTLRGSLGAERRVNGHGAVIERDGMACWRRGCDHHDLTLGDFLQQQTSSLPSPFFHPCLPDRPSVHVVKRRTQSRGKKWKTRYVQAHEKVKKLLTFSCHIRSNMCIYSIT